MLLILFLLISFSSIGGKYCEFYMHIVMVLDMVQLNLRKGSITVISAFLQFKKLNHPSCMFMFGVIVDFFPSLFVAWENSCTVVSTSPPITRFVLAGLGRSWLVAIVPLALQDRLASHHIASALRFFQGFVSPRILCLLALSSSWWLCLLRAHPR